MNDTDGYDANKDPAFMTSEDEFDAEPASVNSWKIPDRYVGSIYSSSTSLIILKLADNKVMAIKASPGSLVFGDLKPSIQIEIVHNLREQLDGAIDAACTKLKITNEEKIDLILYNKLYNRSLEAENITILQYRKKQRAALKKLDHGLAKDLVQKDLSNIFKTTCRRLSYKRANLGVEDVMHAKASDVLLSYVFLDRVDLPRSLAGTWYNGIETRLNGHYDYPTPQSGSWEWAENLSKRQGDLGRFGVTRPASAMEEPRYPLVTKGASGTKSSVNPVATLTDKGKENASISDAELPFWYTQGPPTNVTDSEARYQWNLTKFKLELIRNEKALFEAELKEAKSGVEDPYYGACDNLEDPWYFRLG